MAHYMTMSIICHPEECSTIRWIPGPGYIVICLMDPNLNPMLMIQKDKSLLDGS